MTDGAEGYLWRVRLSPPPPPLVLLIFLLLFLLHPAKKCLREMGKTSCLSTSSLYLKGDNNKMAKSILQNNSRCIAFDDGRIFFKKLEVENFRMR